MKTERYLKALRKTIKGLANMAPMITGVILLTGIIKELLTPQLIKNIFTEITILDSLIGSIAGSILAGNPAESYIIAGEMVNNGLGLIPATAFIIAWVTVGMVQLPAEIEALGKRFSVTRNLLSFIFSMLIAVLIVAILGVL